MSGFIGIGVCVVFRIVVFGLMISISYAANPYKMGEVDYFQQHNSSDSSQMNQKSSFDFREPSVTAEGQISYYTPPSAVSNLLANPTSENARAYINWQKQKVQRIIKAQEMIEKVSLEMTKR